MNLVFFQKSRKEIWEQRSEQGETYGVGSNCEIVAHASPCDEPREPPLVIDPSVLLGEPANERLCSEKPVIVHLCHGSPEVGNTEEQLHQP